MKWLENITGGYSSSAKVVGGTLVLSLPDAKSPVVWRMELSEIKAAAFEIETNKDNDFVLVMKTPKGDKQEIAPFTDKGTALKALMAASDAMEDVPSGGANDSGAPVHVAAKGGKSSGLVTGLVGIVVLFGLVFMLSKIGPQAPAGMVNAASQANTSTAEGSAGVPMSADDFLKNR